MLERRIELIQNNEIDANFIIIYGSKGIDFVNYFMGVNEDSFEIMGDWINYSNKNFYNIFKKLQNENLSLDTSLYISWEIHTHLFLFGNDMDESNERILRFNNIIDLLIEAKTSRSVMEYVLDNGGFPEQVINNLTN